MQDYNKYIYHTIHDEGVSVSILSLISWQDLGSPKILPTTNHLLTFNRRPSKPLGILSQLPILLEGKTNCIDVMVV